MKQKTAYTLMDELLASPTEPLPQAQCVEQLLKMHTALAAIERAADATPEDWRTCADAVNLLETLVTQGLMRDPEGLLLEAAREMAAAGERYRRGQPLRLSGLGIRAMRAVLTDYTDVLPQLSARDVIRVHRATVKRIREIQSGKARSHDVVICSI